MFGDGLKTTMARRLKAVAMLSSAVATLAAVSPAWALTATQSVNLRVLVLSADGTEPGLQAWTAALAREGVPYDTIVANTADPITDATLTVNADQAKYNAVVLATGGLVQCDASGCFSALAADEWTALNAFQAKFGIRRVTAYAYPTPDYGLNWPFQAADISGSTANLTAAGLAAFPALVGTVPLDTGTWGYYAEPLAGAKFATLLAGPTGPNGTASSLIGVYTRPDNFDELVVTYAANAYQLQSLILQHSLVSWATKGIYLGYNRNYFTMHVDDIFLPDDRWDTVLNVTHEDDGATIPVIRMVSSDVVRAKTWQSKNGLQLDMVYNGAGSDEAVLKKGSDPLTTTFVQYKSYFQWINHTYSHPNLDFYSQADIVSEIQKNWTFASQKKLSVNKTELVTGEHSGLANPNMPAALTQVGIKWTAADNSKQPVPYTIGSATTVPRFPSNIYYNTGTFAEQLDEYNYIYFENCVNTATTTCFTAPATWADYVNNEATIMLRHVLTNDARPHYIHQSNLAEDGIAYAVMDELVSRVKKYMKVPITQPLYRDSGAILTRQYAWSASAPITAYYKAGKVYLQSPVAVNVPVTGDTGGSLYGTERSRWISVPANTLKAYYVAKAY